MICIDCKWEVGDSYDHVTGRCFACQSGADDLRWVGELSDNQLAYEINKRGSMPDGMEESYHDGNTPIATKSYNDTRFSELWDLKAELKRRTNGKTNQDSK